jgi:hypothetical protein
MGTRNPYHHSHINLLVLYYRTVKNDLYREQKHQLHIPLKKLEFEYQIIHLINCYIILKDKTFRECNLIPIHAEKMSHRRLPTRTLNNIILKKKLSPPFKYIFLGLEDKLIIDTVIMLMIPYRFSNIQNI